MRTLNLKLQVMPTEDTLSRGFFSSDRNILIENIFAPTRKIFEEGLEIPRRV